MLCVVINHISLAPELTTRRLHASADKHTIDHQRSSSPYRLPPQTVERSGKLSAGSRTQLAVNDDERGSSVLYPWCRGPPLSSAATVRRVCLRLQLGGRPNQTIPCHLHLTLLTARPDPALSLRMLQTIASPHVDTILNSRTQVGRIPHTRSWRGSDRCDLQEHTGAHPTQLRPGRTLL